MFQAINTFSKVAWIVMFTYLSLGSCLYVKANFISSDDSLYNKIRLEAEELHRITTPINFAPQWETHNIRDLRNKFTIWADGAATRKDTPVQVICLLYLGQLNQQQGNHHLAIQNLELASHLLVRYSNHTRIRLQIIRLLVESYAQDGQSIKAIKHIVRGIDLSRKSNNPDIFAWLALLEIKVSGNTELHNRKKLSHLYDVFSNFEIYAGVAATELEKIKLVDAVSDIQSIAVDYKKYIAKYSPDPTLTNYVAEAYAQLANIYANEGLHQDELKSLESELIYRLKLPNPHKIILTKSKLALCTQKLDRIEISELHLKECISHIDSFDYISPLILSSIYNNISLVFLANKDITNSNKYLNKYYDLEIGHLNNQVKIAESTIKEFLTHDEKFSDYFNFERKGIQTSILIIFVILFITISIALIYGMFWFRKKYKIENHNHNTLKTFHSNKISFILRLIKNISLHRSNSDDSFYYLNNAGKEALSGFNETENTNFLSSDEYFETAVDFIHYQLNDIKPEIIQLNISEFILLWLERYADTENYKNSHTSADWNTQPQYCYFDPKLMTKALTLLYKYMVHQDAEKIEFTIQVTPHRPSIELVFGTNTGMNILKIGDPLASFFSSTQQFSTPEILVVNTLKNHLKIQDCEFTIKRMDNNKIRFNILIPTELSSSTSPFFREKVRYKIGPHNTIANKSAKTLLSKETNNILYCCYLEYSPQHSIVFKLPNYGINYNIKKLILDNAIQEEITNTYDLVIVETNLIDKHLASICKKIKGINNISHLPLIVLTNSYSETSKLVALENGAIDYFDSRKETREFALKIKNILSTKNKLKARYAKSPTINASEVKVSSAEEKFIAQLQEIIEKRLSEEDFGILDMATAINLSRSQLHRKLKSIINKSPSQFLRELRLQHSHQLLSQKAGTVSEIAYMVGFKNAKYFSKLFKSKYGLSPANFLKKEHSK